METILLMIIGVILLALVDFFNKLSAITGISPVLGAFIFGIAAIVPPSLWMIYFKIKHIAVGFSTKGVIYALIAGIFIGLMDIVLYRVFQLQSASLSVSIMRTGGIALLFILGIFLLKEKIDLQGILGFLLALAGIILLFSRLSR